MPICLLVIAKERNKVAAGILLLPYSNGTLAFVQ